MSSPSESNEWIRIHRLFPRFHTRRAVAVAVKAANHCDLTRRGGQKESWLRSLIAKAADRNCSNVSRQNLGLPWLPMISGVRLL